MKRPKTLAEQIAELEDPTPQDLDPEDAPESHDSEDDIGSAEDEHEANGRPEHYEIVGKSRLRKPDEPALGPEYRGARVSRSTLLQDSEDDSADGLPSSEEDDAASKEAEEEGWEEEDDPVIEGKMDHDETVQLEGSHLDRAKMNGKLSLANMKDAAEPVANGLSVKLDPSHNAGEESDNALDHQMEDKVNFYDAQEDQEGGESDGNESDDEDEDEAEVENEDEDTDADDEEDERKRPAKDESAQRIELRKMMSEEHKAVMTHITEATKADVEKGRAVKRQRQSYDGLLNTRIRLQQGLIAMNSLSATAQPEDYDPSTNGEAYAAAEASALHLWKQLTDLRAELHHATLGGAAAGRKHILDEVDSSTSPAQLWRLMQAQEAGAQPYRQAMLEKWSSKVRGVTSVLPAAKKLQPSAPQATITDVLNEHLSHPERLIQRTHVPRSCAPLQAQRGVSDDAAIYDDADFYQLQLKELVDQRMTDSVAASSAQAVASAQALQQWAAMREAKTKKRVDTRASKGRKLRYTVHEKLLNFMAPQDRGVWGRRQVDELFGSLLGAKMPFLLEDARELARRDAGLEQGEPEDAAEVEVGLRLFRSGA
ncbi:MAG: rRNA-processing protein bfr2 [Phylliscum demangeonii]|nr:MAG: rRNA-processing protein bfr2 [Phylliscum demangeonii]